ncbi:18436_t:CDS:2, partial [Racocetra fulgida]
NTPAVQDRRHGAVLYMPSFISVRNLRNQIIARIKNKLSDITTFDNIAIPSERWISYQFLPKNPWVKTIFANDKHKIPIEENTATSTGICNRHSAIPANTTLVANNHDFTKLSLTPSVTMIVIIPDDPIELFYN